MVAANSTLAVKTDAPKRRGRPRKVPDFVPPVDRTIAGCLPKLDPSARQIVELAIKVLEESAVYRTETASNPGAVRLYLQLRLAGLEHEEFHAIWLDAQNRVIASEALFSGSLTQTSVYPREVVKAALSHNAAACIFAHNHPSGVSDPSRADKLLTYSLKEALALIDVRVLDHFIVAGTSSPLSFAEHGLL